MVGGCEWELVKQVRLHRGGEAAVFEQWEESGAIPLLSLLTEHDDHCGQSSKLNETQPELFTLSKISRMGD